jgi:hypothetical protein
MLRKSGVSTVTERTLFLIPDFTSWFENKCVSFTCNLHVKDTEKFVPIQQSWHTVLLYLADRLVEWTEQRNLRF